MTLQITTIWYEQLITELWLLHLTALYTIYNNFVK